MSTEIVVVPEHLVRSLSKLRHDVRTPLNHIIGLSDLWADQIGNNSEQGELHADLIRIRDAAWKLNDMLALLLKDEGFALPVNDPS